MRGRGWGREEGGEGRKWGKNKSAPLQEGRMETRVPGGRGRGREEEKPIICNGLLCTSVQHQVPSVSVNSCCQFTTNLFYITRVQSCMPLKLLHLKLFIRTDE